MGSGWGWDTPAPTLVAEREAAWETLLGLTGQACGEDKAGEVSSAARTEGGRQRAVPPKGRRPPDQVVLPLGVQRPALM